MVGFGFMDNTVMLQMGNTLDCTIGVAFGLSTLSAAAMGQACSDVAGILFGDTVERACSALGLPPSGLNLEQRRLPVSKRIALLGSCVGVVCGCCLGMVNLFLIDTRRADQLKRADTSDGPSAVTALAGHGFTVAVDNARAIPPPDEDDDAYAGRYPRGRPAGTRILVRGPLPAGELLPPLLEKVNAGGCVVLSASASAGEPAEDADGAPELATAELLLQKDGAVLPANSHQDLTARLLRTLEEAAGEIGEEEAAGGVAAAPAAVGIATAAAQYKSVKSDQ